MLPLISRTILLAAAGFYLSVSGCDKDKTPPKEPAAPVFAKGADVGWLTEMEAAGVKFYNETGTPAECMQLLKSLGMDAIRLRVWVNPSGGWNNTADVVTKAIRAKQLGMRLMIDFHYSDTWADPGQQTKPAAWAAMDLAGLRTAVYNHTFNTLASLKAAGVTPEWVQVGNETNDGMLWPEGKASVSMAAFVSLINAGYDAVKASDPLIKVIVHISNGYDNSLFRWIFDGLKANNGRWDVIGMSLYPDAGNWQIRNDQCLANMQDMVARYGKEIMITEVGMSWTDAAACRDFISDLITKTKSLPGNKGLGVFYWEPECYNNWQGYTKGAFDNTGKPTVALQAFR